jgi:hypothetical protein
MAIAVFDYTAWITRYLEFGAVSDAQAALFFAEAGLYLDNTDCSPVQDVTTRLMMLNMLTAHIAALSGALNPNGIPDGKVGRVSSATEGSVSISVDLNLQPGTAAWFSQTPYGFAFWQASKGARSATYVAPVPYCFEPRGGYFGWPR